MNTCKPTISREEFSKTLFQFSEGNEAFFRLYGIADALEQNMDLASNIVDAAIDALIAHFGIKAGTEFHGYAFDLILSFADEPGWRLNFESLASSLYTELMELCEDQNAQITMEDLTNE